MSTLQINFVSICSSYIWLQWNVTFLLWLVAGISHGALYTVQAGCRLNVNFESSHSLLSTWILTGNCRQGRSSHSHSRMESETCWWSITCSVGISRVQITVSSAGIFEL